MTFLASSGEIEGECMCYNGQDGIETNSWTSDPLQNSTFLSMNSTTEMNELNECGEGCFLYKSFSYSRESQYAGIFMMFTFFWTSQFIVAVGQVRILEQLCKVLSFALEI